MPQPYKFKIALLKSWKQKRVSALMCLCRKCLRPKSVRFNPATQKGDLPVRMLQYNILYWLENSSVETMNILRQAVATNGLQPGIRYNINREKIIGRKVLAASIGLDRKINTYETFNAYLWCICYSSFVLFDEGIQIPSLRGTYKGIIDKSSNRVKNAENLFRYGLSLRYSYAPWDLNLPNPEAYKCRDSYYVERANSLFVSAMYFILNHEVGHSYFNHVDYNPVTNEQSVQEEMDADNFALDQILSATDPAIVPSLKYGAAIGGLSLIFLSSSLIPSRRYPHLDIRIRNIMERLNFEEMSLSWGIAGLGLKLWADNNSVAVNLPAQFENYQEMFYHLLYELHQTKRQ